MRERRVERKRKRQPDRDLEQDASKGKHRCVGERLEESRVPDEPDVVVESDELHWTESRRSLDAQIERVEHGIDPEREEENEERSDEEIGRTILLIEPTREPCCHCRITSSSATRRA